jgi:hypothetical protein
LAALREGAKVDKKNENICIARMNGKKRAIMMKKGLVSVKKPKLNIKPAKYVETEPTAE